MFTSLFRYLHGSQFPSRLVCAGLATAALIVSPVLTAFATPTWIDAVAPAPASFIAIFVAIFAGSLVAGLAGFAFSAIAGALLLSFLSAAETVPLLLACSIITQLVSVATLWRTMQWRNCVPFLVGGLVGIPAGAYLLQSLDQHTFAALFGGFLIAYSGFMLLKPPFSIQYNGRWLDLATGFAGGITGGAVAFPGAIPTIWCSMRGLAKEMQRGVMQPYILAMQIATLAYFSKLGLLTQETAMTSLWCAPAVLGGTLVGLFFFNRINDFAFRRIVLIVLLLAGATLAIR